MARSALRNSSAHSIAGAVLAACLGAFPHAAAGQAFIPGAGDGTISASYQAVFTRGQLNSTGQKVSDSATDTHALLWHVEFALRDRVAVHASLPYMSSRYEGLLPHRIGVKGQPTDADDGTYHGSFQDFYFGARFKLVQSPRIAVTPFVEAIVPSHHYESRAQSAIGRDLRAVVFGAAVGGFADGLLPGLYFQTRLSYAVVQEVLGIRANRSGVDSAVGYFLTPRVAIQFVETFQFVHDGVDQGVGNFFLHSGAPYTQAHNLNHDRLLRTNVLSLGAGFTIAVTDSMAIFATATTMAWGQNIQRPRSVTVGTNWNFQTRGAPGANPNVTGQVAFR